MILCGFIIELLCISLGIDIILRFNTDLMVQQYDDNVVALALFQLMFHTLYLDLYGTLSKFQIFRAN